MYKRFGLKDANRAMKVMKEEKVYGKVLLCMNEWYCLLDVKGGESKGGESVCV